jgi:hypothetical protein
MKFGKQVAELEAALEAEMSKDARYRKLVELRKALAEFRSDPADFKVPEGYKLVPLTKEEKVRSETERYLKQHQYRAHRSAIAAHLVEVGLLANDKAPTESLSVYLTRWPEFKSQGRGWFALDMNALHVAARNAAVHSPQVNSPVLEVESAIGNMVEEDE